MAWMNSVNHMGKSGKGFVKPGTGGGSNTAIMPAGIYAKIEDYQTNNMSTWFPSDFTDSAGQADSVFGQLSRALWYRGIMWTINWGEVDNGGAPSTWNWTEHDFIMNMIGKQDTGIAAISGRATAVNKKVLVLLPLKTFAADFAAVSKVMPADLLATGTAYSNGMTRYHRLWAFDNPPGGTPGTTSGQGYQFRFQDFRTGLTGTDRAGAPIYTLRNRLIQFVTQLYNRYKDHPAFAGLCLTEPVPVSKVDAAEYNRDQYFEGRLQWMKDIRPTYTKHLIAEAVNFDVPYMTMMTSGTTPGCVANHISACPPNFNTGVGLQSLYNQMDFLSGKVVLINQCQPQDMASKSGFERKDPIDSNTGAFDSYDFPTNPRTKIQSPIWNWNGSTWILTPNDQPNMNWVLDRAIYLKSNMLVYQHEYATLYPKYNCALYNWAEFYADMQSAGNTYVSPNGGLIKNDPNGGMDPTIPTFIV